MWKNTEYLVTEYLVTICITFWKLKKANDLIDYKKAYDMISHSWLKKCMMFEVTENMQMMLLSSMGKCKTELSSGEQMLGTVRIRRAIFQGDILSPLLFVLAQYPFCWF